MRKSRYLASVGLGMLLISLVVGQLGIDAIPPLLLFLFGFAGAGILGITLLQKTMERQKIMSDHIRKTGGASRLSQQDRFRALSDYDRMHDRLP